MALSANDKARFCYDMARHTQATFAQCQRLLRLAATLHRFDVERCNRVETEAHRRKIARLQKQVWEVCAQIETSKPFREHCLFPMSSGPCNLPKVHPVHAVTQYSDAHRFTSSGVSPAFTQEPMACAIVLAVPDGYSDQIEPKGIGVPA